MNFIPFFIIISSSLKEVNITETFIGKWKSFHLIIDQNSLYYALPDKYQLNIEASGDDFIGNLTNDDKSNQESIAQIKIVKNSDLVYSLLVSKDNSEFKEFISSLKITTGVDYLVQAFGHINSTTSFSLSFFSQSIFEVTLYNTNNDLITLYQLEKDLPPRKPPITTLQIFLPMLPIFIMMYNRAKSQNQPRKDVRISKPQNSNKKE